MISFLRKIKVRARQFLNLMYSKIILYPVATELKFPLEEWDVNGSIFGQKESFDDKFYGEHLGEDCEVEPGTEVFSIGDGIVLYSALHTSKRDPDNGGKRNWGGVIMIGHRVPNTKETFISVYGHLGQRFVKKGQIVEAGQLIGKVGKAWSAENGWWEENHLHLAILSQIWNGLVLPGYWKEGMNKLVAPEYWRAPTEFILSYNKEH